MVSETKPIVIFLHSNVLYVSLNLQVLMSVPVILVSTMEAALMVLMDTAAAATVGIPGKIVKQVS